MKVSPLKKLFCPIDNLPLAENGNTWKCEKNHSFDITKDGYCNLLLVQQKNSLDPGDNKEMVQARRQFLESAFYEPIAKHVSEIVQKEAEKRKGGKPFNIVDAGCGEGYYPLYIQKALEQNSNSLTVQFSGFDISKWAIQSASKRTKKISWVVASNRKLPYEKASIDLILSLFGFPAWESFKTAQPIKGKVLLADAGENHLLELREIIYPIVNRSSVPPIAEAEKYGYSLELEERLQFSIQLKNKSDIQNLLAMTPHAYRANPEGLTKLDQLSELSVSVDIVLRHLKL